MKPRPHRHHRRARHDHDDALTLDANETLSGSSATDGSKSDRRGTRTSGPGFGGILRSFFSKIPWHESASCDETIRIPSPLSGAISVHNANGKTRVIGEDRDDIQICIHKKVSADGPDIARKLLDSIRIQDGKSGDVLEIEVQIPRKCSRRAVAHIELRVPRSTRVASRSSNGKICLEGLERSIRARSSNGSIAIHDVDGDVDVTTANAKVSCRCSRGKLHARSSNGKIEVADHAGSIDASTSNGVIKASIESLGEGGIVLSTSNGRIVLDLPDDANADVDIKVENGHIRNDLELADSSAPGEGSIRGRLGKGGIPIRLRTSNGTISLR